MPYIFSLIIDGLFCIHHIHKNDLFYWLKIYKYNVLQTQSTILKNVRDRVIEKTKQPYNTCVIQIYLNGEIGIKPHRDKEVNYGTIIASVSLGATRTMRFEKSNEAPLDISLSAGSLCLIQPPTNDFWLHSIPNDASTDIRISLVFRYFE